MSIPMFDLSRLWSPYTDTNTNTTINFGCNIEDVPTERHVLENVGSYGSQLNRIIDVVQVLISHSGLGELSTEESRKLAAFQNLAEKADQAAQQFTNLRIEDLLDGMRSLHKADPVQFAIYKRRIVDGLKAQERLVEAKQAEERSSGEAPGGSTAA